MFNSNSKSLRFAWQVPMDSYSFHRIGRHSKIPPIHRFRILISSVKLWAIMVMWRLHYYFSWDFARAWAWTPFHRQYALKCFHSSMIVFDGIYTWFSTVLFATLFRLRSFLCGLTLALRYVFAALATKTYYNVEMWLSLPGVILFYAVIGAIGYVLIEIEENVNFVI